jgi:hypothetical protein
MDVRARDGAPLTPIRRSPANDRNPTRGRAGRSLRPDPALMGHWILDVARYERNGHHLGLACRVGSQRMPTQGSCTHGYAVPLMAPARGQR